VQDAQKKVKQRDKITDESGGWLVTRRMSAFLTKVMPTNAQDSAQAPMVNCANPLYIHLVNCPVLRSINHYRARVRKEKENVYSM